MTHSTKPATGRVRKEVGFAAANLYLQREARIRRLAQTKGELITAMGVEPAVMAMARAIFDKYEPFTVTSVRLHKDKRGK